MKKRIIVTNALPYANGRPHLGHILGYVQTDIFARFQRMQGHECYYVCGSDTHGTPIMIKAREAGVDPETMVNETAALQLKDFNDFGIHFDAYHSTHRDVNRELVNDMYLKLKNNGDIERREIEQAYDPEKEMFLPDRFIKGTCPKCGAKDQYGDSCEACGATYDPTEMDDAVSVLSGVRPILKTSEHLFFKLGHYQDILRNWIEQGHLQTPVAQKLKEWFEDDLRDWDISRDAPYFGFEIPDAPGKYFYVWLDAPVGYLASFKTLCSEQGLDFDSFWQPDSNAELYHFIGKDITYFHALFWPAMLHGAGYRLPTGIHTHGFVTVNGEKMSKSRGTFISARQYLDHLNPEYLRYYYAAKLSNGVDDIDLNLEDFTLRVNADLVGKFVNIASRCAGFIKKKFDNTLCDTLLDQAGFDAFAQTGDGIAEAYQNRDYGRAARQIMALADQANQFIEQHKPWELAKDEAQLPHVQAVCTQALNYFRQLITYLKPVLPETAAKSEAFLNIKPLTWDDAKTPLLAHEINPFKALITRIDSDVVAKLTEA